MLGDNCSLFIVEVQGLDVGGSGVQGLGFSVPPRMSDPPARRGQPPDRPPSRSGTPVSGI